MFGVPFAVETSGTSPPSTSVTAENGGGVDDPGSYLGQDAGCRELKLRLLGCEVT